MTIKVVSEPFYAEGVYIEPIIKVEVQFPAQLLPRFKHERLVFVCGDRLLTCPICLVQLDATVNVPQSLIAALCEVSTAIPGMWILNFQNSSISARVFGDVYIGKAEDEDVAAVVFALKKVMASQLLPGTECGAKPATT